MAETFRVLYDNQAWADDVGAITTDVNTAHSPLGFRVSKAFDASLTTQWKITTSHASTDFYAKIDRGAAASARSLNNGLGIANHNLSTAGCESVTLEHSTDDAAWVALATAIVIADDTDYMFAMTGEGLNRYVRLTFNFGSPGLDADCTIGQLYFGYVESFPVPPAGTGAFDVATPGHASVNATGQPYSQSRGVRWQQYSLDIATNSKTTRAQIRNWWMVQQGAVYPVMMHTGEHDGTTDSAGDAWASVASSGGSLEPVTGGGGWLMSFQGQAMPQTYPDGGSYIVGLPLLRQMTGSEV